MKNKMLSLLLSAALTLSCAVPAFAAEDGLPASDAPAAAEAAESGLWITAEAAQALAEAGVTYKDGTYEGAGTGYANGTIKLSVTIAGGKISAVELISQEKQSFWESKNVASLFDAIVEANSPEVDVITGATRSSNGVKQAVRDALSKAETSEPEPSGEPVFASGSGTKQYPYLIETAAQLQAFAKSVNDGESYQGQYISLNSDIDLSGIDWTPIGTSNSFKGVFDGNQYVIENLTIGSQAAAAERDAAGLFGDLGSGGVIRSVGIRNASIYNYYAGSQYVGLLASGTSANSVVDNCWATGTIASGGTSTDTEKYSNIGGLIGASGLKSLVANSWSDVTILSVSDTINAVGGIVGWTSNQSAVVNCAAFGNISDSCGIDDSFSAVGGVVGYSSGAVYACYSDSDLHIDYSSYEDGADVPIGGVVGGTSYMAAAYNCYFNSDAKQSYYGGEVSEPVAVGYDALNYTPSDNEHCEGLPESGIYGAALLEKLSAALEEDQLSAAQAWFTDQQLFSGDVTLDGYLFMTDAGWNSWEKDSSGRLLPTGPSSNFPEEPDCFDGGDGSKADPYVISTEEHLRAFAAATVSGKLVTANRYFRLGADIALSGAWTPIHNFAGSFDGDGHTVSGMTIGTETSPAGSAAVGFFDSLPEGASVQNLKLTGAAVCAKTGSGYNDRLYAGLLAGTVKSAKIDNCTVQGSMVSAVSGTFAYAGGLVGRTEGDTYLTNCIADVPVAASSEKSTASAGGLAGYASGSNLVANCAALGDVSVSGVSSQYNSSAAGGTAAASPKTSAKGGLITVTVTPESGYALGRLTAKDKSGRELALTNKGSGRYAFVMPASNVTVEVSFTKSGANRFADVPSGAYYGDAVAWAVENDITAGTSETAFSPDAAVTRAQTVTFLFRNSQAK